MAKGEPKLIEKTDWKYKIKFSIMGFLFSIIVFFFVFRNGVGFQIHEYLEKLSSVSCVSAWSIIWYFAWFMGLVLPFLMHKYMIIPRSTLNRGTAIFIFNVLEFSALATVALLFIPSFEVLCATQTFPDLRIVTLLLPTAIVYTLSIVFETNKIYPTKWRI